jgi:hypothetical protein
MEDGIRLSTLAYLKINFGLGRNDSWAVPGEILRFRPVQTSANKHT